MDSNGNQTSGMARQLQYYFDEMKKLCDNNLSENIVANQKLTVENTALKNENVAAKKKQMTMETEVHMLREGLKRRDDDLLTKEERISAQVNELSILKGKYGQLKKDVREYQTNAKVGQEAMNSMIKQCKTMASAWDKCRHRSLSTDDPPTIKSSGQLAIKNNQRIIDLDSDDTSLLVQDGQKGNVMATGTNQKLGTRIVSQNGKKISVPQHDNTMANGKTKNCIKNEAKAEAMPPRRTKRIASVVENGAQLCSEHGCGRSFKRKCQLEDHIRDSHSQEK